MKKMVQWKKIMMTVLLLSCLLLFSMFFKAYLDGKFSSPQTLQEYVKDFGMLAPLILTFIQALQVVIPILPGFLGCVVGVVMFGGVSGFWCNYIGISLGSIIAFLIARQYGKRLVEKLFSGEKYEKWANWAAGSKSYSLILLLGMILPLFPDDFFCYFTGLTKMRTKKFVMIIILGKPWCILAYSILVSMAV